MKFPDVARCSGLRGMKEEIPVVGVDVVGRWKRVSGDDVAVSGTYTRVPDSHVKITDWHADKSCIGIPSDLRRGCLWARSLATRAKILQKSLATCCSYKSYHLSVHASH